MEEKNKKRQKIALLPLKVLLIRFHGKFPSVLLSLPRSICESSDANSGSLEIPQECFFI